MQAMPEPADASSDDAPTPATGVRRTHRATRGIERPAPEPVASRRGLLIVLAFCAALAAALALYMWLKSPAEAPLENTTRNSM